MPKAIFISYRRDDSEGEAGRLFDDLTRAFGADSVFMDVSGISPGVDFRHAVEDNVATCGVLLAVIGRTWASITNSAGQRRLDDPADFVALEISSALKRGVPVIPVLVHEASMPVPAALPDLLKDFAYRNSIELSHARWSSDVQLLITALKPYVRTAEDDAPAGDKHTVHGTVPVQLPAPQQADPASTPPPDPVPRRSKAPLLIAATALLLLILAAAGLFLHKEHDPRTEIAGTWKLPGNRSGDSLDSLIIAGSAPDFTMHAFASDCKPTPCDWRNRPATWDGHDLHASFTPTGPTGAPEINRVVNVAAHPDHGNLVVSIENTYKLASLGPARTFQLTFVRSY